MLKEYKNKETKNNLQNFFDYCIRQIELSIREIGYGDATINKKMKEYVNLFYSILEKIENWEKMEKKQKLFLIADLINIDKDNDLLAIYFDKFREFLLNNPLKIFTKDILELKF